MQYVGDPVRSARARARLAVRPRAQGCKSVIVTRTPFRVTLGGGGTDLPSFYEKHGGYVLAAGIDKYMYLALNVPLADTLGALALQRERDRRGRRANSNTNSRAKRCSGTASIAASRSHRWPILPAGTGLGSSSCYLVGLLNAERAYFEKPAGAAELAEEACDIELRVLKKPIGKQDQYMAAFGGLTELRIARDGARRRSPAAAARARDRRVRFEDASVLHEDSPGYHRNLGVARSRHARSGTRRHRGRRCWKSRASAKSIGAAFAAQRLRSFRRADARALAGKKAPLERHYGRTDGTSCTKRCDANAASPAGKSWARAAAGS